MHGTRPERVRAPHLVLCKPHSPGFFIRWGWPVATAPASKQAASLFIRTGHGQGDKADHDVRLLLCGLWDSQPAPAALRSSLVTRQAHGAVTEDNRAWRRRISWDGRARSTGRGLPRFLAGAPRHGRERARAHRRAWRARTGGWSGRGFCLVVVACW